MAKVTIKPHPHQFGNHAVYRDGELVASYWFERSMRQVRGHAVYEFRGQLFYADGRVRRLDNFAWAADVRKYVRSLFT